MSIEKNDIDPVFSERSSGGYTTPDGYFEELQKTILRKTVDHVFTTPENYFETLETRINLKLAKPQSAQLRIIHFKKIAIGIAASLLLVSGLFFTKNIIHSTSTSAHFSEAAINELSDEEIIKYVEVSDIKDSHLAEILPNTNEDKTQKQVEDYLINNADEQLITDEL